jgi:hypothetical protein
VPLDVGLKAYVDSETGPGSIFTAPGHAAELGVARLQDELSFIQAACRSRRATFDAASYWRIHRDVLAESMPNPRGRPLRGAKPGPERAVVALFFHPDLVDWITQHTQPRGPFSEASPVPHAIETGLRLLQGLDTRGPVRSARFPFDGDALWARYLRARRDPA